jgi:CBS domain-containing protein
MTVAAILKHKGAQVETVRPTATVQQVCDLLSVRKIGAVVVVGAAGEVIGIVSERDLVGALASHGASGLDTPVADIMTRNVSTCRLTDTSNNLMELALDTHRVISHAKAAGWWRLWSIAGGTSA